MCEEEEAVGAQGRKLSDPRPTRNWLRKAEEGSRSIRWQGKRWSRCSTHHRSPECVPPLVTLAHHPPGPASGGRPSSTTQTMNSVRERGTKHGVQSVPLKKFISQKDCWKESMFSEKCYDKILVKSYSCIYWLEVTDLGRTYILVGHL